MSYRDLDPKAAHDELLADATLRILDVRTEPEYRAYRLANSKLLPVQELEHRLEELDRGTHWLVHCEHGMRSLHACELLARAGFTKITNLRGGLAHWAAKGLPVEKGAKH